MVMRGARNITKEMTMRTIISVLVLFALAAPASLMLSCGPIDEGGTFDEDSLCAPQADPPPDLLLSIGSPCSADSQCRAPDPEGGITAVCEFQENIGCVCVPN